MWLGQLPLAAPTILQQVDLRIPRIGLGTKEFHIFGKSEENLGESNEKHFEAHLER